MAGYDGSIRINTQLNTKDFEKGSKSLISGIKSIGNSLRGIIGSLGFGLGIAGLVALGKQAIDTASDIQEVQNVVDTAFGSMSYKMEEFAQNSVKQFGISQLSAKQLGSTFMAMGASMLDNMEKSSDMAINLTARAADMASFYNKSIEETSFALKSIYTGETESLKEYGVVMTQVNLQEFARQQGINKSIQAMTQAEKVELQYAYVMQQTALAAGDFAKTSDSWANQTRILSEQFKELLSILGSGLITVLTPVIKFLNTVLTMLIAIAKQIGAVLSSLFGIKIPTADSGKFASDLSAAAGGADDLANGMDAAGKSAEKAGKAASKALAPFDRLNVLSKDSGGGGGSGSGAGGGAGGGGFEMPELSFKEDTAGAAALGGALDGILDRLKQLKDLFVKGFFEGLGDYKPVLEELKKDILSIGKTLKEIFTDPEVVAAANRFAEQLAYSLGQVVGSIASIGLTIAQNLVGGMEKYLTQNKERIKQYIVSMLDIGTEIAAIIGNFSVALADIFSVFGSDTAQQITGNLIGIFVEVGMLISENAAKLGRDILNMIAQPIIDNKDKIKDAIEGTLKAIEPFTSGLLSIVQNIRGAVSKVYDEHLKPLFDSVTNGLSKIVGKLLDGYNKYIVPVFQGLGDKFKEIMEGPFGDTIGKVAEFIGKLVDAVKLLWENVLIPFFSWAAENIMPVLAPIVNFIGETVLIVLEKIIKIIGNISGALSGIIDFVVCVFTGDWEKAWNGIKKYFSETWDSIKNLLSTTWEIIGSLIKNGVELVKSVIIAAWERIKTTTSIVWNAIKGILSTVLGAMKALVATVFNVIKTTITTVWNGIKSVTSIVWNGIKSSLTVIWNILKTLVSTVFNAIKKSIINAWNNVKVVTSTVWNAIKTTTSNIWNGIKKTVTGIWNELKSSVSTVFNGIKDTITNVWDSVKTATSTIWEGIKNAIKAPINAIIGFINGMIRGVINGINGVIGVLNGLNFKIPDWIPEFGGKSFGFNIPKKTAPQIPYLASGAVIRGGDPFMAVLGDQPRGQTNIETPLPTMIKAFKQAMEEMGGPGGGEYTFIAQIDGKTIFNETVKQDRMYRKTTGRSGFAY